MADPWNAVCSVDSLLLVREYFSNKIEIIERDDQIILGKYSWNKNAKTSVLIWGTGKKGIPKDYHDLESIVFFLKKIELFHPEYVQAATAANIEIVRRPMRKLLHAYLKGDIKKCPFIDPNAPRAKPSQVLQSNGQGSTVLGPTTKQQNTPNSDRSKHESHQSPHNRHSDQSGRAGPQQAASRSSLQDQQTTPNRNESNSQSLQPRPGWEHIDTERIQLSPISDQSSYDDNELPPTPKRSKPTKIVSNVIKSKTVVTSDPKTVVTSDRSNEYNLFGKHIACELSKMSQRQAIIAQEQIQSIISRCRLDNLNK